MYCKLSNGKQVKIPDKEIQQSMQALQITKDAAIQMYLEDEGYCDNQEQETLETRAKENRITATIHQAKNVNVKRKTQKERVQKDDPLKEQIIQECAKTIENLFGNATITNKTKIIAFEVEGEQFELNLIRHRKPKGGGEV